MHINLNDLITLLALESIDADIFRGQSLDIGLPQLYGGHVLAQCLSAASQTLSTERRLHSFHGYFIRPGNPQEAVIYQVERLRDGGSFSVRQVQAIQQSKVIFTGICSFQTEEDGLEHQELMPSNITPPEQLAPTHELYDKVKQFLPLKLQQRILMDGPVEMRPVVAHDLFHPEKSPPIQHIWFKVNGELNPDAINMHQYIAGYMSDFNLLTTALLPHGISLFQKNIQVASLDHSIHFHRKINVNQWILYSLHSPWAGNGRGISYGKMFSRDGKLLASTSQEGLIRLRPDWLKS